ncbi:uncharacterized protein RJT21DRAFT_749 [Scheffersomyces amazonensis]|uniref:uncharacterized protein n=1 Tax=Scheffersomyces amazonensis TaxID=1078765 RepID=UPI00315DACD2
MISIRGIRSSILASKIATNSISVSVHSSIFTRPVAFYSTKVVEPSVTNQRITEKGEFNRKTYLIDLYKHINDNNDIVLYVHHNNINKADNATIRSELKKINESKLHVLRSGIYEIYLKNAHEEDPAAKGVSQRNRGRKHPLLPIIHGPTAIISISKGEPEHVEKVIKLLKKYQDKLILVGAKVEKSIYNVEEINEFKSLPNKLTLQSQLAGLLTILGGAGLVRTLEAASTHLYLTLEERRKDIDPNEKKEDEPSA